jgi:hypothetical protein
MALPKGKDWNKIMSAASGPAHYRNMYFNTGRYVYGTGEDYPFFMTGFEQVRPRKL